MSEYIHKKMNQKPPLCPVCRAQSQKVLHIDAVPAHCNLLWPTRAEASRAPQGQIDLCFCPACGHFFNAAFQPELMAYSQEYENSLHFSPHFQQYATALAKELINRYDLRGRRILEIGSGKGDFLRLICELGGNRGIGFDASYVPDADKELNGRVRFIQDFYSEQYADQVADLICCRHVLEHIAQPDAFIAMIRRAIGDRTETAVFFELPNVLYTLRDLGIWDLIYEHCSYFSRPSLAQLFTRNGFAVSRLSTVFGDQFLTIEATPRPDTAVSPAEAGSPHLNPQAEVAELARLAAGFAANYAQKIDLWRARLARLAAEEQKVVVWGAGSKGVTFLNVLPTRPRIAYAVDINPRKQGMYVAGSGQQIVPPNYLQQYRPDVIITLNQNYRAEIGRQLAELGLSAAILAA